MVLYFSGTGNSRYTAEIVAEETKDELVSINQLLKDDNRAPLISKEHPFIFVTPTYAWRMPRIVEKFIKERTFSGINKAYFIMTCGVDTGYAASHIKKLCKAKGFQFQGFAKVVLPENYITMYKVPENYQEMIKLAESKIHEIGKKIYEEQSLPSVRQKKPLNSSLVNWFFY